MSQFDWREYLELSKLLIRAGNTITGNEACLRSSISRAYYSVFCYLRPLASREGLTLTYTGEDHLLLIEHFKNFRDSAHKKIGKNLFRLKGNRTKADYYDSIATNITKLAIASTRIAQNTIVIASSI